jgi:hypothetical protein
MCIGGDVVVVDADGSPCSIDLDPVYVWIDGADSISAVMNFEASGFVDVRFCPSCGIRSNDISRTYDRQHVASHPGYVLTYNSAIGLDVFTSDLSPTAFFCTQQTSHFAPSSKLGSANQYPIDLAHCLSGESLKRSHSDEMREFRPLKMPRALIGGRALGMAC